LAILPAILTTKTLLHVDNLLFGLLQLLGANAEKINMLCGQFLSQEKKKR
jgi:hypothetical protein